MHRFVFKLSAWSTALAALAVSGGCFTTFPRPEGVCGNGIIEAGEECDDGNQFSGDGCSFQCLDEIVAEICGNSVVEGDEDCDPPDNVVCSLTCRFIITPPECGNGIIEVGEECEPPSTPDCSPACTLWANQIEIGTPCDTIKDCGSSPNPDLQAFCANDPAFPNGMCVLLGCSDLGAGDNCPTGSLCVTATLGGGGTANVCAPDCTPGPNDNGGCRPDEDANGAYACFNFVTGGGGVCWSGCSDDSNCNDPFLPEPEWPYACDMATNRCYAIGTPGAEVGDPCFDDTDCMSGGTCFLGDWTGDFTDDWPGGYCSKIGCDAMAGNPVFDCPAGSTCGTETPWITNITLDICLADCVGDGAGGDCNRAEYTCMDFADQIMPTEDAIAGPGDPGWCFHCPFERTVFGEDPATCP